jgi:hypothetical protein
MEEKIVIVLMLVLVIEKLEMGKGGRVLIL